MRGAAFYCVIIRGRPKSTLFPCTTLFRSRAEHVRVSLRREGTVRGLLVDDDGEGFDPAAVTEPTMRLGLRGMLERVALLRSEEHTSELQSRQYLACRLLPEK